MSAIKLFCIPYAGASAMVYRKWEFIGHGVFEVVPVELAGRGLRAESACYNNFLEAVDDVIQSITAQDCEEYAIFGHSMGSWIAYEAYRKLQELGKKLPVKLFISGSKPPFATEKSEPIHQLPEHLFQTEIINMGGTPKKIFEDKALSELFLPILRSDYTILEEYEAEACLQEEKIKCDTVLIYGSQDTVCFEEVKEWQQAFEKEPDIHCVEGGHFFVTVNADEVIGILEKEMSREDRKHNNVLEGETLCHF